MSPGGSIFAYVFATISSKYLILCNFLAQTESNLTSMHVSACLDILEMSDVDETLKNLYLDFIKKCLRRNIVFTGNRICFH